MEVQMYEDEKVRISVADNPHPDKFSLSFDGVKNHIRVKRVDSDGGWGQNLKLSFFCKSSLRERIISFGPSKDNESFFCVSRNPTIPRLIHLCYHTKKIPEFVFGDLKKLNPDYDIKIFDDEDCKDFIGGHFGGLAADCFSWIPNGSIKADFWRSCVVSKLGGVYFDIDIRHLLPIEDYLCSETTFLTSTSITPFRVNPIVIMSRPANKILDFCVDSYIEKFKRKTPFNYWGWSICEIMFESFKKNIGLSLENKFNKIIKHKEEIYQFLNEDKGMGFRGNYTHWRETKVLYNHHDTYVRLNGKKGFLQNKIY